MTVLNVSKPLQQRLKGSDYLAKVCAAALFRLQHHLSSKRIQHERAFTIGLHGRGAAAATAAAAAVALGWLVTIDREKRCEEIAKCCLHFVNLQVA